MAIFKKKFSNADDYEEWLQKAGTKINVLEITNPPSVFKSSYNEATPPTPGPVIVRYQTHDKSFSQPSALANKNVQAALIAAGFLALSILLMFEA